MKVVVFLKNNGTQISHGAVASVSKVDYGLRINYVDDSEKILPFNKEEWEVVIIQND